MAIVETLFAVLDGQSPGGWPVWNTTFGAMESGVKAQESFRPLDLPILDTVRLQPLLVSPGALLMRNNWRTIVGCFIDANASTDGRVDEIRTTHMKICHKLKDDDQGYWRKYGYQLITILGDDSMIRHVEPFMGKLWNDAKTLLGEEAVLNPQDAYGKESLIQCVRHYLKQAVIHECCGPRARR